MGGGSPLLLSYGVVGLDLEPLTKPGHLAKMEDPGARLRGHDGVFVIPAKAGIQPRGGFVRATLIEGALSF